MSSFYHFWESVQLNRPPGFCHPAEGISGTYHINKIIKKIILKLMNKENNK